MRIAFFVGIMAIAAFVVIIISKNIASQAQEEGLIEGTEVSSQTQDIENLRKDLDARKEEADQERRLQVNAALNKKAGGKARVDVPEFREEADEDTLHRVSALPSAMSKWQSWCMLATIVGIGWVIWIRVRPHK